MVSGRVERTVGDSGPTQIFLWTRGSGSRQGVDENYILGTQPRVQRDIIKDVGKPHDVKPQSQVVWTRWVPTREKKEEEREVRIDWGSRPWTLNVGRSFSRRSTTRLLQKLKNHCGGQENSTVSKVVQGTIEELHPVVGKVGADISCVVVDNELGFPPSSLRIPIPHCFWRSVCTTWSFAILSVLSGTKLPKILTQNPMKSKSNRKHKRTRLPQSAV